MMRWNRLALGWIGCWAVCGCLLSGCGEDDKKSQTQTPVVNEDRPDPGAEAQAAVKKMIADLKQGRPSAIWDFLPPDYQADLNALLHQFADQMDAELWNDSIALFRKLARVLKAQKQYLGSAPTPGGVGRPRDDTPAAAGISDWGRFADVLEALASSDLSNLDRLKKADGGELLVTVGGKLIEQLQSLSKLSPSDEFRLNLNQLGELHVETAEVVDGDPVLNFQDDAGNSMRVIFSKHRGKWIPLELEADWLDRMGNARAWLAAKFNREAIAEQKPRLTALIRSVDRALDKMESAKTAAEFTSAGQQTTFALIALFAGISPPPPVEEPESASNDAKPIESRELATVIVTGMLTDAIVDGLRTKLMDATDAPDRAAGEFTGDDENCTFRIGPVADVSEFAKRLEFLSVTQVKPETRTIFAKLPM